MGYCAKNHIIQSFSGPYSHESNGIAERFWKTIITITMTLLLTSSCLLSWWPLAFEHANFLRQRLPHRTINFKTPYFIWNKKEADLRQIHIWGCLCYYHVDQSQRANLDLPAREGIYVGNTDNTNAYTIVDMLSGKVLLTSMITKFVEVLDSRNRLIKTDVGLTDKNPDVDMLNESDIVVIYNIKNINDFSRIIQYNIFKELS